MKIDFFLPLDIDDRTCITWLLYGNWSFNRATRFFNSNGVIECMPNDFKSNKSSITLFPSNLECKVCLKSWEIPQQVFPSFDNIFHVLISGLQNLYTKFKVSAMFFNGRPRQCKEMLLDWLDWHCSRCTLSFGHYFLFIFWNFYHWLFILPSR